MINLDAYSLGILLVGLGLFFWLTTRFLVQQVNQTQTLMRPEVSFMPEGEIRETPDAVIIVQSGGKLASMNHQARKVFHVQEHESPGLERLARWARPSEPFLTLCAKEGRERFVLDGRLVEGTSYPILFGIDEFMVVSFKPVELTLGSSGAKFGITTQSLRAFTELTLSMTVSLSLEITLQAILENVDKLFPSDFMEVNVFDDEKKHLTPYTLSGYDGGKRSLIKAGQEYSIEKNYLGLLEKNKKPLLVSRIDPNRREYSGILQKHPKVQSYLGIPLVVEKELVGALELFSLSPDTFQEEDLDLIRLLAGQAAVSIRNAQFYQVEEKRAAEFSGLADLSGAFRSARDPQQVFSTLVGSIAPLVDFEIFGFILYDENERTLIAQVPFQGLPAQIVELYRLVIKPDSLAEKFLIGQDVIYSENASEDPQWEVLGLDYISKAASMRETVLVPLTSGGRMMGYLQASNHTGSPRPFSREETHFLTIVANQTAPIVENATLVQQTRSRAQRAETLRRIASLASSDATLDETLTFAIRELTNLLHADVSGIFLLNEGGDVLRFHQASFFGGKQRPGARIELLSLEDPQFPFSVTGSQHVLRSGNLNEEQAIIPFYKPIIQSWGIKSVIAVPLIVRDEGVGELWLGSNQIEFFDQGDLQAVVTAAGQLAGVVDQAYLVQQTDESLRRRIDQLTALTRISREVGTSLDINHLLQLVHNEAIRTTTAEFGTILFFEFEGSTQPTIRYSIGESHSKLLTEEEQKVLESGESFLFHSENGQFSFNPANENSAHSALVVPIYFQQKPAGLIILYSSLEKAFDETAVEIAQSLASHTSVVIASVIQQQERLKKGALPAREARALDVLPNLLEKLRRDTTPDNLLMEIGAAIREVTGFQMLVFSLFNPEDRRLHRVGHLGLPDEAWQELSEHSQLWEAIKPLLKPEYHHGAAYYIPAEQEPVLPQGMHSVTGLVEEPVVQEMGNWDPDDMLLIPLMGTDEQVLGLISLDAPLDGRQPDDSVYEPLMLFAYLSVLVVENANQVYSTQNQLAVASGSLNALKKIEEKLPKLLHKDLEQTLSIKKLRVEKEKIQALQNIVEMANWQPDIASVLRMTARELLTILGFQVALIGEQSLSSSQLLEVIHTVDVGSGIESMFGQKNPLRQLLEDGDSIFVSDISQQDPWQNNPLLNRLSAKSFIGLPLLVSNEHVAGLLLVGQHPIPELMQEERNIYAQLARQVSVSLQNLYLLTETQRNLHDVNLLLDFSRKLGSLDIGNITQVLLDSVMEVISSADAAWVGLWDEENRKLSPQSAVGYKDNSSICSISYFEDTASDSDSIKPPLPIQIFKSEKALQISEKEFIEGYHFHPEDLMRYQQGTGGLFPLFSVLVPLRSGDTSLGILVVESFDESKTFDQSDETLLLSLAQQAGLALENARLFISAEQRTAQLQALTKVSGTITSSLQSEELINSLLNQLKTVVLYDTATLWLKNGNKLAVAATNGFSDQESRVGLSVEVQDSSLFQEMIKTGEPISIQNVLLDERIPTLLEPHYFSWLGIPLLAKSELIGVVALEKRERGFYTPDRVQAAMTFSGQAAVSLENARLYEESVRRAAELDQRTQRLTLLNRFTSKLGASLKVDYILEQTGIYARDAVNASGVAILMLNEQGEIALQYENPQSVLELPYLFPKATLFDRLVESLSVFSSDQIAQEPELSPLFEDYLLPRKAQSILVVPLAAGSNLYGWLLVLKDKPYRFSFSEIELERTICNQAAISVQNASLYLETRNLSQNLEVRVKERSAELQREHQNTETLLRISNELSGSLDINEVLSRVLKVINESLQAEQSLIFLPEGNARVHKAGSPLVTTMDRGLLTGKNPEREIANWVMKNRQFVLISNIQNETRWDIPEDFMPGYQSLAAVPMVFGEEVLGTLMLLHREGDVFKPDQVELLEASARQIGTALNKAELFKLIRDQAENLGGMLREQQIEASRSRAILEAVADGVVVTDNFNRVTLFNRSAEEILDAEASQIIDQPVETLTGFLGIHQAERIWMDTIAAWAQNPSELGESVSYTDQFELVNGRYVAVSLAPVLWNANFMGTVSIFRDISHEVQVDRLKSEFIANVSHELRTPMTSIKGYAQVLLMGAAGELSDQQKHFVEIISNNTTRLSVLVNDLLDVSRIEASKLTLMLQPLDLQKISEDIVADMLRLSEEENKSMTMEVHSQDNLPLVSGDPARVRQIFSSLLSNAYNYTPDGGRIVVNLHRQDQEVQVDIQDNGLGIPFEEQDRIFERFYRGESSLEAGIAGTGLGLSIAKTLVEMHLGRIWFRSSGISGEGSVFSFTLPVVENEE